MTSETGGWHYASPNTVPGALQRGLGRGAHQVLSTPDASDLVTACLRRDYRWDWQVDERDVYLARLVRDLRLPIAPIIAQLHDAPPRYSDYDNAFTVALGVLEVLGRADVDEAVEGVRCYIGQGDRWLDALETVAGTWPTAWWDDLYPTIADRIGGLGERAAYLKALVTLDPAGAQRKVIEGLWDCEADVRLVAAQRTPLDDQTRKRLQYLHDDPMETAEVRAAATNRLT
jgi:hypothetical protein